MAGQMRNKGKYLKQSNPHRGIHIVPAVFAAVVFGISSVAFYKAGERSAARLQETEPYASITIQETEAAIPTAKVDFDTLRFASEQLEGTFTITVLSARNELYFIKGNNPMCIWHYPEYGVYVYASTMEILQRAMHRTRLQLGKQETIRLYSGEILRIDTRGIITRSSFDDSNLYMHFETHWSDWPPYYPMNYPRAENIKYIQDLKAVASCYGLFPEDVDSLLADGVPVEEIEEYLYCR